ncbi:MAG: hypothetical protein U1E61_03315 [Bradyrhizobium sp.]
MAENAFKYRLFRHSTQQSSQNCAVAVQEMPYFAADFAQLLVPQLDFPITRRSDSLKKPYKKAAPGDSVSRPGDELRR